MRTHDHGESGDQRLADLVRLERHTVNLHLKLSCGGFQRCCVNKECGLPTPTPLDGEEAVRLLNVLNSDVLRWDVQAATFRAHLFHHPENFCRHLGAIKVAGVDGSPREPHLRDSLIVMMHRWTPVAATGSGDV
jgi:hypothetical protein